MPRKSKKNLFKRGESQRYNKLKTVKKHQKTISQTYITETRFSLYSLILLAGACLFTILLIPLVVKNSSYFLRNLNFTFVLPDITIPNITIPAIHFPDISINLPTIDIKSVTDKLIELVILINPFPLLLQITNKIIQINTSFIVFNLQVFRMTLEILSMLDPRPGFGIVTNILYFNAIFVAKKLYPVVIFLNPLPVIKIVWEIEFYAIGLILTAALAIFGFISDGIYQVLELFLLLFYKALTLILGFFGYISSVVNGVFMYIYNVINNFWQVIVYLFSPITNYISMVFTKTLDGFIASSDSLGKSISNTIEQYNEYHPR